MLAILVLCGCGLSDRSQGVIFLDEQQEEGPTVTAEEQFYRLREADPIADAERAFAHKDFRFAGVNRTNPVAPGIQRKPDADYQLKLIVWSQKTGGNALEAHMDSMAFEYASSYNRHLVMLFNKSSKH
jgi:hypothetical protein